MHRNLDNIKKIESKMTAPRERWNKQHCYQIYEHRRYETRGTMHGVGGLRRKITNLASLGVAMFMLMCAYILFTIAVIFLYVLS